MQIPDFQEVSGPDQCCTHPCDVVREHLESGAQLPLDDVHGRSQDAEAAPIALLLGWVLPIIHPAPPSPCPPPSHIFCRACSQQCELHDVRRGNPGTPVACSSMLQQPTLLIRRSRCCGLEMTLARNSSALAASTAASGSRMPRRDVGRLQSPGKPRTLKLGLPTRQPRLRQSLARESLRFDVHNCALLFQANLCLAGSRAVGLLPGRY